MKSLEARLSRTESSLITNPTMVEDLTQVSKLNLMEAKVKTLEARVSSKPVTVAGRTFLSLPDVEAWIVKSVPSSGSYLYYDCVSLLENINATDMCRSDINTDIYQTQKVGLKAEAEARQIASFRITLPAIFVVTKRSLQPPPLERISRVAKPTRSGMHTMGIVGSNSPSNVD